MPELEQRDIVCVLNDAVFRVTRPASASFYWPTTCEPCLSKLGPQAYAEDRGAGIVVDHRRALTKSQAVALRDRWRGRLGRIKRVSEYPAREKASP